LVTAHRGNLPRRHAGSYDGIAPLLVGAAMAARQSNRSLHILRHAASITAR